jgi:hypothetical protein
MAVLYVRKLPTADASFAAESGHKKNTTPQIRLASAFPLFCGGPLNAD